MIYGKYNVRKQKKRIFLQKEIVQTANFTDNFAFTRKADTFFHGSLDFCPLDGYMYCMTQNNTDTVQECTEQYLKDWQKKL